MNHYQVGKGTITLILGDLADQQVDAIVNAANPQLAGGGGVDGALHRAAGPMLLQWCQQIPSDDKGYRCPTGEVRVTPAANLPARWVIHGVGPIYSHQAAEVSMQQLRSVHEQALAAAAQRDCQSIALPAISTGVYGYPVAEAAPVALGTARDFLLQNKNPADIRFVLFNTSHHQAFQQALDLLAQTTG
jgi:O-acetyl-ADP-ribose deacetylase (regulator of RNase III)